MAMCILGLSKTSLKDFHYNDIKKKHGHRVKLLFTETNSLTNETETNDVYEDFRKNKNKFENIMLVIQFVQKQK